MTIIFVIIFCEYLIYFITLSQCDWPEVDSHNSATNTNFTNIMFITDIHLLPNTLRHIFDGPRFEWQMSRSFETATQLFDPKIIFILGDTFDTGEKADDYEFVTYIQRFKNLFLGIKTLIENRNLNSC